MKVFLAIPYSQLCDNKKYELKGEYRIFFEKLIKEFKKINCDYFLAHEREAWGKEYASAEESTKIDFETIKTADLVCIIPGIPASGGVHVEIGWASANKRKLRIFFEKDKFYSPMVTGINCLTDTKYYYYEKEYSDELIELIMNSVKEEMEKTNG